jgi:hypothetical protein
VLAAVFLIATYKHIVRRVQKQYFILNIIPFKVSENPVYFRKKRAAAHICHNRHFIEQIAATRRKLHKRGYYCRRNVINAVKAYILKRVCRLRFSRARHSRYY